MRRVIATVLWGVLPTTATPGDHSWRVEADAARCLFENIDAYRAVGDDPVIIFLEVCPDLDADEGRSRSAAQPGLREVEPGAVDAVIVFTQAELACLEPPEDLSEGAIIDLPKRPECRR